MNKANIALTSILFIIILTSLASAVTYNNPGFVLSGSASTGGGADTGGVGWKIVPNQNILLQGASAPAATAPMANRVLVLNSARTTILCTDTSFNGTNTTTPMNCPLTAGTTYYVLLNATGGGSWNWRFVSSGPAILPVNLTHLNYTHSYYNGDIQTQSRGISSLQTDLDTSVADSISFIGNTPSSGADLRTVNFSISTQSISNNLSNTTIRVYTSAGALVSTQTVTGQNVTLNYSLVDGDFLFNATLNNVNGTQTHTATRTLRLQTTLVPRATLHFPFNSNFSSTGTVSLTPSANNSNVARDLSVFKTGTGSLIINGTGGFLNCTGCDSTGLRTGHFNATMMLWVYKSNANAKQFENWMVLGQLVASASWNMNYNNASGTPVLHFATHSTGSECPFIFNASTWYHMTFRYIAGSKTTQVLINGDHIEGCDATETPAASIGWGDHKITFGNTLNGAGSTQAQAGTRFDDARYYEEYLSDAQIGYIVNAGLQGLETDPVNQTFDPTDDLNLTDCETLDESDSTYTVQNDISMTNLGQDACFRVAGHNITLDLNGFTMTNDVGGLTSLSQAEDLGEVSYVPGTFTIKNGIIDANNEQTQIFGEYINSAPYGVVDLVVEDVEMVNAVSGDVCDCYLGGEGGASVTFDGFETDNSDGLTFSFELEMLTFNNVNKLGTLGGSSSTGLGYVLTVTNSLMNSTQIINDFSSQETNLTLHNNTIQLTRFTSSQDYGDYDVDGNRWIGFSEDCVDNDDNNVCDDSFTFDTLTDNIPIAFPGIQEEPGENQTGYDPTYVAGDTPKIIFDFLLTIGAFLVACAGIIAIVVMVKGLKEKGAK